MGLQEVTSRIRFSIESLGAVRKKLCSEMLRDPQGRVMYLATWWRAIISYAARVLNRHQGIVGEIEWDPIVDGVPKKFRRFYSTGKYALHEAFLRGDVVGINCVLPDGISIEDFRELLEVAGTYKGISPYRADKRYGTFDVLQVESKRRREGGK